MCLLFTLRTALSAIPFVSDLRGVDVQGFLMIPHQTCQIPKNCQCKWLLVSLSATRTSAGSSGSPRKFLLCMGKIVATELPIIVPPRQIDDCYAIHLLHREFCDLRLSSHQKIPLWARLYQWFFCKKQSLLSSSRYRKLGPSESACRHYAYPYPVPLFVALWDCFHRPTSLSEILKPVLQVMQQIALYFFVSFIFLFVFGFCRFMLQVSL